MELDHIEVNLWTDSQIVLAWIAKEPGNWKTFVGNRVSKIQQCTENMHWRHISSIDNPADIISRGMHAKSLVNSRLWWNGPSWLSKAVSLWPVSYTENSIEIPEKRETMIVSHTITNSNDILDRYSTFRKLQRVIAYIFRFVNNSLKRHERQTGILTPQELENSLLVIIKSVQAQEFKEEITMIKQKKYVSEKSKLANLNPILDNQGVLRVGGRIHKSQLTFEEKNPIILPSSHRVTYLIIKQEHHKQLHAGAQTLLHTIRLKFWIIKGLSTVKKVLRNCITCFRAKPGHFIHQMGELPSDRVIQSLPFSICGVDYAGPIEVKEGKIRKVRILKSYICIFVCFVTKAVHIELAIDLTSEAFINVLKRFIARRGKPSIIHLDNERNFTGAQRKIQEMHKLQAVAAEEGITVHRKFIPPRSPHFGGLWEAGVKSIKQRIKRTIGATVLTWEELQTLCTQIEGCLNSRLLTAMSDDPNDLTALTPHFLLGRHLSSLPEPNFKDEPSNHFNRYKLISKMKQHFWSRWSKEYLTSLQERWEGRRQPTLCPKEGSLVLIQEDDTPPLQWRMGRITKVHTGADGIIRVVQLKTSKGTISRPITKLCPLPEEN